MTGTPKRQAWAVLLIRPWRALQVKVKSEEQPVRLKARESDLGVGFIAVFATREEAEAKAEGARVLPVLVAGDGVDELFPGLEGE